MEAFFPANDPNGPIVIKSDMERTNTPWSQDRRRRLLYAWKLGDWRDSSYIEAVRRILRHIIRNTIGRIVWDELRATFRAGGLEIYPYFVNSVFYPQNQTRASRGVGTFDNVSTAGVVCGRTPGPISDLDTFRHQSACTGGTGRGRVEFTPWWYEPADDNQPGLAGGRRDEVLLHEIVHALRQGSYGWAPGGEVTFDDGRSYGYLDEFFAILVANYYSAMTGRPLRRDHDGFRPMEEHLAGQPGNWIDNPALGRGGGITGTFTNRDLVDLFVRQQDPERRFADRLAAAASAATSPFNPIAQL